MEQRTEERIREPKWVPYPPPPQGRLERAQFVLRRYGFVIACALFALALGVLFFPPLDGTWPARNAAPPDAVSPGASASAGEYAQRGEGAGGLQHLSLNPYDGRGTLAVTTEPAGATVLINSVPVGDTPLREHTLAAGAHVLSVQKEGYRSVDSVVVLRRDRPRVFSITLRARTAGDASDEAPRTSPERRTAEAAASEQRASEQRASSEVQQQGQLRVASQPAGATARLDGRRIGQTPLLVRDVPPGAYTVTLEAEGHRTAERSVTVRPAQTEVVDEQLRPLTGALSVLVRPWGAIYIDGRLYEREADVRYMTVLPVGRHRLTVVHPELGTWERTVNLDLDETTSVVVDFNNPDASFTDEQAPISW